MKNSLILFSLLLGLNSCSQNEIDSSIDNISETNFKTTENLNNEDFPIGTNYSNSAIAIQGAYNQFIQKLRKNDAISIVAQVDHSKNANSVGLELDYTRIVFFGNPTLGTPLMQENQLAGLDLPQKVLFYRTDNKSDILLYNSVSYLRSRHNLDGVATLDKLSNALENLVSDVSKSPVMESAIQNVEFMEGIITKESNQDFETSYATLKNAIVNNPNLSIVAELDHQANAERVGLDLRPTRLIIFGNPNLGTPLMQNERTIGLDLPQKMLVWKDEEGKVKVSYNDIYFLAERHVIEGNKEILDKISTALENLSNAAAGK
ncbi:DUF302 domain-containing protein [Gillisia sp. Hel_I_29]|uniref:DUF302 domain-containing protein n=1 Tax=Gillisia sp. Hel_I_29 TaxID=1249975 RepID=UPI0006893501|nr:DUF302 domain-containing protein [Gillisia sp. Hel_I_29]|tara:strand:- start:2130 stop:3086 length:957 start_codon:yes stop_codon:yes gene_type:complete